MKSAHTFGIRSLSCLLTALLIVSCIIPASAAEVIGSGVEATCDEAYYATTDYYGNLMEGSVVKSYVMNGASSLTDYGTYDSVVNLTDGTVPNTVGGSTTFDFASVAPSHFYFEGKTAAPFDALPWKLSMHYTLNGVPTRAEELAGKTGVVEIFFDAIPNEKAAEYARNNYTLEAMAIFNQDDILSLEAEGAQIQLIGNLRAVLFVILPGEEQHFSIRVGSEDFSFGGMTFLMVPATLFQLSEIAKLADRKDDIEENYRKLSDSLDTLLDSVGGISSNLYVTADGLDELNTARGIISNGKGNIYDKTDTALNDLKALNDSLSTLPGHLDTAAEAVDAVDDSLDDVSDALHDLQERMEDTKDDLDALQSALNRIGSSAKSSGKDLKTLGGYADTLKNDFDSLQEKLAALNLEVTGTTLTMQGMTVSQINEAIAKAKTLHTLYSGVSSEGTLLNAEQFLTAALIASGNTAAQAQALLSQVAQISSGIEQAMALGMSEADAKSYVYNSASMTSEQIEAYEAGAARIQQLQTIYTTFAPTGAMDEAAFFAAMIFVSGAASTPDEAKAQAQKLLALYTASQNLTDNAKALCDLIGYKNGLSGDLSSLLSNTGSVIDELNDLSDTADDLLDEVDDVLDALDDLGDTADKYIPDLKATLTEAKTTVTTLMTTVTDTHSLLTALRDLLKAAGEPLNSGTKKTLEGLAASLRATAKSLGTTGNVKSAKNNIGDIIEDLWNEYTGETNNLLLIDANAAPQSLTDSRNSAPASIQVLIRTQEIKTAEPPAEEIELREAAETTFFQRVAQMFRDFWSAIIGIFH